MKRVLCEGTHALCYRDNVFPFAPQESLTDRIHRFFAGPPGWLGQAPATRTMIWLTLCVFAGQMLCEHTLMAAWQMEERTLLTFGANYVGTTLLERRIENLLASCFVHGSLLHLTFNLFALRNVGPLVEYAVGPARFVVLYLLSGILGSVASTGWGYCTEAEWLSVGGSGAICGILGGAMMLGWRTQGLHGHLTRATFRWLGMLVCMGVLSAGAGLRIDNAAHAGGLLGGMIQGILWRRGALNPTVQQGVLTVCALLLATTGWALHLRIHTDPWVNVSTAERFEAAIESLAEGDCAQAKSALEATQRLLWTPPIAHWMPTFYTTLTARLDEIRRKVHWIEEETSRRCPPFLHAPLELQSASLQRR